MIKEVKNFFRGMYPAGNNQNRNKNTNIYYKESQKIANTNSIIDATLGDWQSNPLSLLSISPVSQALNQYTNAIDGMDLLIKNKIQNKPDSILNDRDGEYREYQGGYYFNNKIVDIKDIFKKIIIINELYYRYYVLYNKDGFIDIILNNVTKSKCGMYITIIYHDKSYKFTYDVQDGLYKAIIKGVYINSITDEFEFCLYEHMTTNLDNDFINTHKTPLYPILPLLATYQKAIHTNLYEMSEMQKPKGILTFEAQAHPDSIEASMNKLSNVLSNGGVVSLDAGANYKDISIKQDMQNKDTVVHAENSTFSHLGVPIVLIRTENSTYDNYKTSYSVFIESILSSKVKKGLSLLNHIIFKEIQEQPNLYIAMDWNDLFMIKERRIDHAINLKNNNIITLNEARRNMGVFDDNGEVVEIDGGSDIYIQNNLVKIADAGALKGEFDFDSGEVV